MIRSLSLCHLGLFVQPLTSSQKCCPLETKRERERMNLASNVPFTQIQRKSTHSNPRKQLHLVMRLRAGVS